MKSLYCRDCNNYLMGGDGECHDCPCGWKQDPDEQEHDPEPAEQLERVKEFAATLVGLLRELHDNKGWDELSHSLDDVLEEAVELDVICEDELP